MINFTVRESESNGVISNFLADDLLSAYKSVLESLGYEITYDKEEYEEEITRQEIYKILEILNNGVFQDEIISLNNSQIDDLIYDYLDGEVKTNKRLEELIYEYNDKKAEYE